MVIPFLLSIIYTIRVASGSWENIFNHAGNVQTVFYTDGSGNRLVEAIYVLYPEHRLTDCYVYGDRKIIDHLLQSVIQTDVLIISRRTLKKLMHHCSEAKMVGILPEKSTLSLQRQFGMFSGIFIYPGTKWCGAGNISESFDDLGEEIEADMCCREHDHCEDYIGARESRHGLKNKTPVTKSHCNCDEKFYNCLQIANTDVSNRIGNIYFNMLCMECFKKDHPIIACLERKGRWPFRTCQRYKLDMEKEPIWQFFDPKRYKSLDEENEEENEDFKVVRTHLKEWNRFSHDFKNPFESGKGFGNFLSVDGAISGA